MFVTYNKIFELVNFASHVLMTYISARNLHQFYETLSNCVNLFLLYLYEFQSIPEIKRNNNT